MDAEPFCKERGDEMKAYIILFSLLLLASCNRRELTYYEVAEITLTADWSQSGLEGESDYGATAVFYPKDGEAPQIVLMGDRTHATTHLRKGHYSVIVFNRSFKDFGAIAFRGENSFHTFEAYAKQVENRSTTEVIVTSPEKLATCVIEEFEVTDNMLGNYTRQQPQSRSYATGEYSLHFIPTELTNTVKVQINVDGLKNVKDATCRLGGIPASVLLHNGQCSENMITHEFSIGNPVFHEGSSTDGTLTGKINVFGFNEAHEHNMSLSTNLVDGKTKIEQTFDKVNVSKNTDETGAIYLHVEAKAPEPIPDVEPEKGPDSGFNADVDGWGKEEHTELPL